MVFYASPRACSRTSDRVRFWLQRASAYLFCGNLHFCALRSCLKCCAPLQTCICVWVVEATYTKNETRLFSVHAKHIWLWHLEHAQRCIRVNSRAVQSRLWTCVHAGNVHRVLCQCLIPLLFLVCVCVCWQCTQTNASWMQHECNNDGGRELSIRLTLARQQQQQNGPSGVRACVINSRELRPSSFASINIYSIYIYIAQIALADWTLHDMGMLHNIRLPTFHGFRITAHTQRPFSEETQMVDTCTLSDYWIVCVSCRTNRGWDTEKSGVDGWIIVTR